MRLDRLFSLMDDRRADQAIAERDASHSYADLIAAVDQADNLIDLHRIGAGDVIGVQADFSFRAIALALALFRRNCIVAFLSPRADIATALADCAAAGAFRFSPEGTPGFHRLEADAAHPLLESLRAQDRAGFIIFSSGSSGKAKAILHDLDTFLSSYDRPMKPARTLAFLLFDHIAGLDTLFYTLHAGGTLVVEQDRSPPAICRAIARWQVEILPTSPSFLKLLCVSGAAEAADLSSLRIVTFGSEPMDSATLARIAEILPNADLRQKYGSSEFGAPSVKTRAGDELWIKFHGDSAQAIGGMLWVRAASTMLGYLNADPPMMRDGWLCTGDRVEVRDGWMRILGRESDLINVGGEKVFPSEVEAVISEIDEVAEVAVSGESHPLMGQVVSAMVRPKTDISDFAALRSLVRRHCMKRLMRYKVPTKISFTTKALFTDRQKVVRHRPTIAQR
jgi:long-chain acyl-CoA synthetase